MSRMTNNLRFPKNSMVLGGQTASHPLAYGAAEVMPAPRPGRVDDAGDSTETDIADASAYDQSEAMDAELTERRHPRFGEKINWGPAIWLIVMHAVALTAPWTFTWSALILMVTLHWVTGSIGICLGFHRLLTHTGFIVPQWLRRSIAVVGTLAGEGGPVLWTANHRRHHAFSDQEGDPHSPQDGTWWSHMFWLAFTTHSGDVDSYLKRWAPDLAKDRFMMGLEKWFLPLHIVAAVAITAIGYAFGGWPLALSFFVWGVALRMVLVLHVTWAVNSASHLWGYRNYKTRDDSRNLWWVAVTAYGEGWHNNHHAHPRLAQHGHKWWEFDITYQLIRFMRAVGLAKDVVDLKSVAAKKAAVRGKKARAV